nr:hypothetical protein CFP56_56411 [Quercus suber]
MPARCKTLPVASRTAPRQTLVSRDLQQSRPIGRAAFNTDTGFRKRLDSPLPLEPEPDLLGIQGRLLLGQV